MEEHIKVLLEKTIAGDEVAFNEVFQRYQRSVYIKAYQYLKNDADAKDATQEVFFEVNRSLKNLRNIESFYSWLMMVTSSKCLTMTRRRKFEMVDIQHEDYSKHYEEKRVYMDPKKSTHNNNEKEILVSIIDSLSSKHSEIIKLIYFDEMKLIEIAEHLRIPLGTVKTRSALAKRELKKKLERFERREHYQLTFHADVLFPTVAFGMLFPSVFANAIKQGVQQFCSFVSKQTVMAVCSASMVGLVISGGSFIYQDMQAAKQISDEKSQLQANENKTPPLPLNTFQTSDFQEETISSYREAYYACLNFAPDETSMMNRTIEEYEEIIPIYHQVKNSESIYFTSLQNQGWVELFENYAFQ